MSNDAEKFKKQLMQNLEDYTADVLDGLDAAAKKYARLGAKELRKKGPIETGEYRKGWRATKVNGYYVIHNKKHYLTHLLEYGHATADGTGRVNASPHIKEVEEKMIKKYVNEVIEVISK